MYSEIVTERQLAAAEKRLAIKLRRYIPTECEERTATLNALVAKADQKTGEVQALKRPLVAEEEEFIRNEQLRCRVDFQYWAERYATIIRDGGAGRGKLVLWDSQRRLLEIMGRVEERCWAAKERGETVDGIRIALNKARQLGATCLARCLLMHRLTQWPDHRAMAASIDDDKIMELYDRDKLLLDGLPWFLRPAIGFDVKGQHIYFDRINSRVLYQQSKQQSGLGQGRQFELAHLTECASFPYPDTMIEMDFFPTLPQSIHTLCLLESTPQGRGGWWHDFTEDVRAGHRVEWTYIFIPWYIESKKYRRTPPDGWNPSKLTQLHAAKVLETSPTIVGRKVELDKEQLYWYETNRHSHQKSGKLNVFLTNYCATHEESFQHIQQSAVATEVIEELRLNVKPGVPYEFAAAA